MTHSTNTPQNSRVYFDLSELNRINMKLRLSGFEDYHNTWEKFTSYDEENMTHVILTCTKDEYSGVVVDIYYSEPNNYAWLMFSNQHNSSLSADMIQNLKGILA